MISSSKQSKHTYALVYGVHSTIYITAYVQPILLLKLYLRKDDKSTSDNLRLNFATVLDDTTDSGKLLKQCTHLFKKSFANN